MNKRRKILTVIPARGGSKGIAHKNIVELAGKPLIEYTIEATLAARNLDRVIVSTDDPRIADTARNFGVEIPFLRPPELSTGKITLILVMRHALEFFDKRGESFDAVLSLQPTSPLLKTSTIEAVVEKFHSKRCDAVATLARMREAHPYTAKRLKGREMDEVENFVDIPEGANLFPRQKREPAFYFSGAIYLRDRSLIENFKGHTYGLGDHPSVVVIDDDEAVDINEPLDLELAEILLRRRER